MLIYWKHVYFNRKIYIFDTSLYTCFVRINLICIIMDYFFFSMIVYYIIDKYISECKGLAQVPLGRRLMNKIFGRISRRLAVAGRLLLGFSL